MTQKALEEKYMKQNQAINDMYNEIHDYSDALACDKGSLYEKWLNDYLEELRNLAIRTKKFVTTTPDILAQAAKNGTLKLLIHPFDEIQVSLDTGKTISVICGFVRSHTARFIMKNCWCINDMNPYTVKDNNYFNSTGRAYVLQNILSHISPEWREIMKPRLLVEEINGHRKEYEDLMWLPSATDVFGSSEEQWKNEEDSFQLPIFWKKCDRVKSSTILPVCENNSEAKWNQWGQTSYYLRTPYKLTKAPTNLFWTVDFDGDISMNLFRCGFAPGFDI